MGRVLLGVAMSSVLIGPASAGEKTPIVSDYIPVVDGPGVMITSNSSALSARETAGPDTFALYGGPDQSIQGKFQLANGLTPDWGGGSGLPGNYGGGPDAWVPVDNTDLPVFWHRSQVNAQTLGTSQPSPNHAMWCGVDVGDPLGSGWEYVPGYGNSWHDALLYESVPISDSSVGQTVSLDFYFHHDTEPGFDYFNVEYDSAGFWRSVLAVDGSNKDTSNVFNAPGVQFSAVQTRPIVFTGNDYSVESSEPPFGDRIRIRLIVSSDGAWSDQDGLWPTHAGAAQVDEFTLTTSQGTFTEDFEGELIPPDRYLFYPDKAPFAGDFADVYPRITDLDPCRENRTPLLGFMDYGQIIRNGPGLDGTTSIVGGSTSPGINYGIAGNHVVNFSGGLSFGRVSVYNEVHSPDIYWDLPGAEDDGAEISGAFFRFTLWSHLPLHNGIFYVWGVTSALPGEDYLHWSDRGFVYYGGGVPHWINARYDVSDLMQAGPERVQMNVGVIDYAAVFGFVGSTATPSPCFDDAAFYKYRLGGPTFATRTVDTANDGFPVSGSIDASTPGARDGLDIPFNMARDISIGELVNDPGDSVVVDVSSAIPGASVTDIRMVWAMKTNPVFEDALRSAPARIKDESVVAGAAGTVWTGEVVADTSKVDGQFIVADRFFVDLPDVDFMYPGDVLHYYIQAIDSDGRTTTLPADTSGFLDFASATLFNRAFTVRGLPTLSDTAGAQPKILVWNDFGRRGGEAEFLAAFDYGSYWEGVDFDTYTTQGPTSGVSNGLGSAGAHGATADQLAGYEHLFYFSGNLSTLLLSNGTNVGNNDKGDDIGLLEQWHGLPGIRNCAYFGDGIATALVDDSAEGLAYLNATMGVSYGDSDVRDVIDGQTAPIVVPNAAGPHASAFTTNYVAYGGCLTVNTFDQIQPNLGAAAGHLFTDETGVPIPENPDPALGGVASVINPTANGLDVTFPYGLPFIYNVIARHHPPSARDLLFAEILYLFEAGRSHYCRLHDCTGTEAVVARRIELSTFPNPFNPATVVQFTAPTGSKGSVKVFNLRGELVRTLHAGEFTQQEFRWDGVDDRGASVASGVYVVRAEAQGKAQTTKVALVK